MEGNQEKQLPRCVCGAGFAPVGRQEDTNPETTTYYCTGSCDGIIGMEVSYKEVNTSLFIAGRSSVVHRYVRAVVEPLRRQRRRQIQDMKQSATKPKLFLTPPAEGLQVYYRPTGKSQGWRRVYSANQHLNELLYCASKQFDPELLPKLIEGAPWGSETSEFREYWSVQLTTIDKLPALVFAPYEEIADRL